MNTRTTFIHEGEYVVAVEVEDIDDQEPGKAWGPYLTIADEKRLEQAKSALRTGDMDAARRLDQLYRMTPVPA